MFVDFQESGHSLRATLVTSRRAMGWRLQPVRVATIGSVELPMSVSGRAAFWCQLHETLAHLGDRVPAAQQAKIMAQTHARVPMVTVDERR